MAQWLGFLAAALVFSACVQWRWPRFTEFDSFYHYAHASIYAEHGPLYAGFPWAACSELSRHPGNLWYGFDLLLVPLTGLGDPLVGLRIAGTLTLTALLALSYAVFRRLDVGCPWAWPFLLIYAAPGLLFRWMAVRPFALSVPLCLLLLAAVTHARRRATFLCGFGVAFLHLNFAGLALAIAGAGWLARGLCRRGWPWGPALAALAGTIAGWAARPACGSTLDLLQIQMLELARLRAAGIPLLAGTEMSPLPAAALPVELLPLLLLWLAALGVFGWKAARRRLAWSTDAVAVTTAAGALSLGFFVLTLAATQRGLEPWAGFAVLFASLLLAPSRPPSDAEAEARETRDLRRIHAGFLLAAVLLLPVLAFMRTGTLLEQQGREPEQYRGAMRWLAEHSPAGDRVFHARWSVFPELLFWNRHNTFLGGNDPVFLHAFDPALYWMMHRYSTGEAVERVDAAPPGSAPEYVDTHEALARRFGAKWLVLDRSTPALAFLVSHDPRFEHAWHDDRAAVFRILP